MDRPNSQRKAWINSLNDSIENTGGVTLTRGAARELIELLEQRSGPSDTARNAVLEEAAKLIEYRGQCAVAMINAEERLEEKKAYAWDALQHGIAIRALKNAAPQVGRPDIPEREPNTEPPARASSERVVVPLEQYAFEAAKHWLENEQERNTGDIEDICRALIRLAAPQPEAGKERAVLATEKGLTPTGQHIADCERDAARYRWLRSEELHWLDWVFTTDTSDVGLDAAVDAARRSATEGVAK